MRTFTAIELPEDIRNSLAKIKDKLSAALPKVSWTKPENLHLSLKFIGEISPEQADNFKPLITRVAETTTPFEFKLESLGVFPHLDTARIIWAGTDAPEPELLGLAETLEKKFTDSEIPRENRPYRAHVTLGRIKHTLNRQELKEHLDKLKPELTAMRLIFKVTGITLFQITLGAGSPVYSRLQKTDFKLD